MLYVHGLKVSTISDNYSMAENGIMMIILLWPAYDLSALEALVGSGLFLTHHDSCHCRASSSIQVLLDTRVNQDVVLLCHSKQVHFYTVCNVALFNAHLVHV